MAELADHGRSLQHVLADLSTLAVRDLVALFKQHGDAERFPELLGKAFGEIVRPYAHAAGTVTAQWYGELAPGSDYKPTPFVDLPDERLDKTVGWAMNAPGKAKPLDRLAGSTKRMVADGSRTTVVRNADTEGVRWVRLAAEDACEFCRMLALRGAAYRGYGVVEDNIGVKRLVVVGRSGRARGSRKIGESYHDHCRCVAVPVRDGTVWTPPAYVERWADEYHEAAKEAGGSHDVKSVLSKWRANNKQATRDWLEAEQAHKQAQAADELERAFGDEPAPASEPAPVDLDEAAGAEPAEAAGGTELDRVLAEANAAMEAGEFDKADELLARADTLEQAEKKAAAKAEKAAAKREAADRAKWDRVNDLIDQGYEPDEAQAEAFGVSVERVRRDTFIAEARANGHKGRGFDDLLAEVHAEKAADQYWEAEAATNGYMVKRKYEGKVDPRKLWTANETTAREWMSEEMAAWFDEHGRITRAGLREAVLAGRGNWRNAMTEDFLQ